MESFNFLMFVMVVLGVVVFVALYFVDVGYGKMVSEKWGPAINNKIGWALMECPVFLVMFYFWYHSSVKYELPYFIFFLLFELHYFHRSFICPFLMRGNSKMPITIMALSVAFNLVNGYIQGRWLFELAPTVAEYRSLYTIDWFKSWQFIAGIVIFFTGMLINWHSDYIIRHLREPGDTKHYLPKGGFYNFVTSANYFGEIVEWAGWALLTWSWAGFVFVWFTMANLVPRANSIYHKYEEEFAPEFQQRRPKLKRVFPFIY